MYTEKKYIIDYTYKHAFKECVKTFAHSDKKKIKEKSDMKALF